MISACIHGCKTGSGVHFRSRRKQTSRLLLTFFLTTVWCGNALSPIGERRDLLPRPMHADSRRATPTPTPCASTSSTTRYDAEDTVLRELYEDTGGPSWTNATHWMDSSVSHCEWFGVTCACNSPTPTPFPTTERVVTQLVLFIGIKLIDPADSSLHAWHVFSESLVSNKLDGTLPNSLGGLSGVSALWIAAEQSLRGTIPQSIVSMTLLESITVHNTAVSGTLPIMSACTSLQTAILDMGRLSGTIGSDWEALDNLNMARISTNSISGSLPGRIGSPAIETVALEHNRLSGTIQPEAFGEPGLFINGLVYSIHNNDFSGTIPAELSDITSTLIGYFGFSSLSGSVTDSLASMTSLVELDVSKNEVSGTIPTSLFQSTSLTNVWMSQSHGISGTMPESFNIPALIMITLHHTAVSGHLPDGLSSSTAFQYLFAGSTVLSGTLPSSYSSLNLLRSLSIEDNQLSGTTSPGFSNWTELRSLDFADNDGLDFDLQLLNSYSSVVYVMLQNCAIRGTLPTQGASKAQYLLLDENKISGTMSEAFITEASHLHTMSLSSNRISGELPLALMASTTLGAVLWNSNRLSGTLPDPRTRRQAVASPLKILSLSRNYMIGSLKAILGLTSMATLIVSSNYFSCEAPGMEDALNLGVGVFEEPHSSAKQNLGKLTYDRTHVNPYNNLKVEDFDNTVLLWAGNSQLTTDASLFGHEAPRSLEKDAVKQGQTAIFPGYNTYKTLVWVVTPSIILFYLVFVIFLTCKYGTGLLCYNPFSERDEELPPIRTFLLQKLFLPFCFAALLGSAMVVFNALTPAVRYDDYCYDPLMRTTASLVGPAEALYQWWWAILQTTSMIMLVLSISFLRMYDRGNTVCALYSTCRSISSSRKKYKMGLAVNYWRERVKMSWHHQVCNVKGRILFWMLHIPVWLFCSLPSFVFVIAKNVPTNVNGGLAIQLCQNTMVISVCTFVFCSVIPYVSTLLARVKYGLPFTGQVRPEFIVRVCKTQVVSSTVLEVLSQLVSPVIATILFDESCLRLFLYLTPELHSLLLTWQFGETGAAAYRNDFCSRSLIVHFSNVWLLMTVVQMFFQPIVTLFQSHPSVEGLMNEVKTAVSPSVSTSEPKTDSDNGVTATAEDDANVTVSADGDDAQPIDDAQQRINNYIDDEQGNDTAITPADDDAVECTISGLTAEEKIDVGAEQNLPHEVDTLGDTAEIDGYEDSIVAAAEVQQHLVTILVSLATILAFGGAVPILLLLAPISVYLQLDTLEYMRTQKWGKTGYLGLSIGRKLAIKVLVQVPLTTLFHTVFILIFGVTLFIMVDLQFGIGPVVFFVVMAALTQVLNQISDIWLKEESKVRRAENFAKMAQKMQVQRKKTSWRRELKRKPNRTKDKHIKSPKPERSSHTNTSVSTKPIVAVFRPSYPPCRVFDTPIYTDPSCELCVDEDANM